MSYDIQIGNLNQNYTSNVSSMWDKAMPSLNLRDMHGLTGKECVQQLAEGVEHMARNRHQYLPLEPENGWGDYGGALALLVVMLIECETNPDDMVLVFC